MTTMVAEAESAVAVEEYLRGLGRKVELGDVTNALMDEAFEWLLKYEGTFKFLVDVRYNAVRRGALTPAQAKGVLNCWRADLARHNRVTEAPSVEPGIYIAKDGSIVKAQMNKAGTNMYAKVWTDDLTGDRLTLDDERTKGGWVYQPGAIYRLEGATKMTLEQAKKFILMFGKCVRCGRTLKAADSVERGIGPVCVEYFGGWGG
jgi:Family of unknown function (DUF6011)